MPSLSNENRERTVASLVRSLRYFIAGVILYNQRVAEQLGMHSTDLQLLHLLQLLGPSTPGTLAEYTGLTTGGVTVALDRLERTGYTRRERNPADRRSVLIHTRPAKQRKLDAFDESINEQLNAHLAAFSEGELEIVLEFFTKMNEIRGRGRKSRETDGS